MKNDTGIQFLRHTLATLAYRAGKVLRDAPNDFDGLRAGPSTRSAGQILSHMGDLMDGALLLADGRQDGPQPPLLPWKQQVARFYALLKALDNRLKSGAALETPAERLFQGPIADALTHVGQLATLRRLAGAGIRGENYFQAEIAIGRVGEDQPPPVFEFD